MNQRTISEEEIVNAVLAAIKGLDNGETAAPSAACPQQVEAPEQSSDVSDDELIDVALLDENEICLIENPRNKEALLQMKRSTPARTLTGRVGDREKTLIVYRKNANLAAMVDAVWTPLNRDFVCSLGYPVLKSLPTSKEEYLMRPDLGQKLDAQTLDFVRTQLPKNPQVQIVLGEGQSNHALETGMPEILPALLQGLQASHIDYGMPVFVEYTRVGVGDLIGQEVGAKVVCVILGERPGLLTWKSLGCYITYQPQVNILESKRTVVSNIQDDGGTPPAEAGAYIADLIKRILQEKKSGIDLIL